MRGIKKYIKPLPIRYIILVFFLIIIITILFFKSKQGFDVPSGGIVTVTSDSGEKMKGGAAVCVDSRGNIYSTDGALIYKMDRNGKSEIFAGGGTTTSFFTSGANFAITDRLGMKFLNILTMATDSSGNIYFSENASYCVRKIDIGTNQVSIYLGGFRVGTTATNTMTVVPYSITIKSNILYFMRSNLISKFEPAVDASGNVLKADASGNVPGTILTIAGGGSTYIENGPALNTSITASTSIKGSIVVDSTGNIYFLENSAHRIRKLTPNSDGTYNVSRVAGTGTAGFSGDDGPALSANLNNPQGIALDSSGNIYFIDINNYRIRKVDTKGIITTVAGNGLMPSSSMIPGENILPTDAFIRPNASLDIDSSGNIYFIETGASPNIIRKIYK